MTQETISPLQLPLHTKAVLFDLDDTLHYRYKAFRGWASWFAQKYLTSSQPEEIEKLTEYMVELDKYGYTPRDSYFEQLHKKYPHLPTKSIAIPQLIKDYQQEVSKYIIREKEMFFALQTLQNAHIPFGVVTNGKTTSQKNKLAILGIDTMTNCIFISEEFGAKKPDPSIFLAAAHCLNTRPEDILFLGDNPLLDIWGAHQVGMKTVWVHHEIRQWPSDLPTDIIDMTIYSLADFPQLFKNAY